MREFSRWLRWCFCKVQYNFDFHHFYSEKSYAAAAAAATAAKSRQSCPTLCDPIDGSPPGSPVPGILQARTLEWGAIAFSKSYVGLYIIFYIFNQTTLNVILPFIKDWDILFFRSWMSLGFWVCFLCLSFLWVWILIFTSAMFMHLFFLFSFGLFFGFFPFSWFLLFAGASFSGLKIRWLNKLKLAKMSCSVSKMQAVIRMLFILFSHLIQLWVFLG